MTIEVPDSVGQENTFLCLTVEYELGETSFNETVAISGTDYYKELDITKQFDREKYPVKAGDQYRVSYERNVNQEFHLRRHRRTSGMRVTWSYTPTLASTGADQKFVEQNKYFIWIVNSLQEKGLSYGEKLLETSESTEVKFDEDCQAGELAADKAERLLQHESDISSEPIHLNISQEVLKLSARIYFSLVFCPDNVDGTVEFYKNLFEHFPADDILKTLARILFVAKKKKVTEQYRTAIHFFREITRMLKLQYRDLSQLTLGSHYVQKYPDLRDHEINDTESQSDWSDTPRLVNHPVHIEESNRGPSAFIPFCSFGGDMNIVGRKNDGFKVPVCAAFEERVYGVGRVCYHLNVNRWEVHHSLD